MTDRESLRRLLLERSVKRGNFTLASGQQSSYYIDCRLATMSAEGMRLIGRMGWEAIQRQGWQPAAVGGLTMGADPVACAIAGASVDAPPLIHAFSVRKAAKEHGAKRRIEGNFDPALPVVVVEDVITSGASALQAIEALQAEGGTILGVLAVVDREQGGRVRLQDSGFTVVSLTTTTELLATSS